MSRCFCWFFSYLQLTRYILYRLDHCMILKASPAKRELNFLRLDRNFLFMKLFLHQKVTCLVNMASVKFTTLFHLPRLFGFLLQFLPWVEGHNCARVVRRTLSPENTARKYELRVPFYNVIVLVDRLLFILR